MDGHISRKRGFAGLQVIIAVVILGAIFVMTLKGVALIEVARSLQAGFQLQQFQNRVMSYQVTYRALPGDDPLARGRYGRDEAVYLLFGAPVSFAGNQKIEGRLWDVVSASGEQFMAWRDLRYAGMIEGDPTVAGASAMPENTFGGVYGFDEGNLGQKDGSLCLTRVPGRAAQLMDRRLDDGVINKGRIVATSKYDPAGALNHFDAPDSEPYDFEKEYIICAPILP